MLRIKDSPKSIAAGFAVGTAIALFPTFGLGVVIGLGVVVVFKKISKISLFSSFVIWNPAILVLFYTLSYKIGAFILKDAPLKYHKLGLMNEYYLYSTKFLLGNFVLVVITSTISYFLVYHLSKKYQRQYKEYIVRPLEEGITEIKEGIKEIGEIV